MQKCATGLRQRNNKKEPRPRLSPYARPCGLWAGPEPAELRVLTYIERRILNLARVYLTVKRVMVKDAPWGKSDPEALPQYSTNNVVAYPQDLDATIRTVCVVPEDLYKVLTLQFVGTDPTFVAKDSANIVHLQHLRAALYWLATHNWLWLEATKSCSHALCLADLGAQLESMCTV